MSKGSRIAIGTVAGLLGVLVFIAAFDNPGAGGTSPVVLFGMSGFALCIATACFFKSSLPVTLRIIGAVVCGLGVFTVYGMLAEGDAKPRALLFGVLLAGGGAWLAATGKYPSWGAHGAAFQKIAESNKPRADQDNPGPHDSERKRRPEAASE